MKVWWDEQFSYRIPVMVVDPLRLGRRNEPVRLDLIFDICRPHPDSIRVVDNEGVEVPNQIIRTGKGADGQLDYASLYLEEEAARMETPIVAAPGTIERFYPL
jgi:hypothetical protein